MKVNVKYETNPKRTFRFESVCGMFDMDGDTHNKREYNIDLPIEKGDWNIGLVVGPSGSGKTTIGKNLYGGDALHTGFDWSHDKCVLDDFDDSLSVKEITNALSKVGFSSPPGWLQPFHTLSNGQQFRVELARVVLESKDVVVVDEWTSVVDRTVAQIGSHAVQKMVRKMDKRLIALSCHYDVIDWLQPDWIYNVETGDFKRRCLQPRPAIDIRVEQVEKSGWRFFKNHHYLNHDLFPSSTCYVAFIKDKPVAWTSHQPLWSRKNRNANVVLFNRTVVVPDYQGLGLGVILTEMIGDMLLEKGMTPLATTSHPGMIHARARSNKWSLTNLEHNTGVNEGYANRSALRVTAGFQYVGNKPTKKLRKFRK